MARNQGRQTRKRKVEELEDNRDISPDLLADAFRSDIQQLGECAEEQTRAEAYAEHAGGQHEETLTENSHHQWLWFDDGNITICSSDGFSFKLHAGILSHHSEPLKNLIVATRSSLAADKAIPGSPPLLVLPEIGADLRELFELIYDGGKHPYFDHKTSVQFSKLRTVLLLALKYKVKHIVDHGMSRLKVLFPTELKDWTDWILDKATFPVEMYPADAIAVVQLARDSDHHEILPAVFYTCSGLPPMVLVCGVRCDTGDIQLSDGDLRMCLEAPAELLKMRNRITSIFQKGSTDVPGATCVRREKCLVVSRKLASQAFDAHLHLSHRCFSSLQGWIKEVEDTFGKQLCTRCKNALDLEIKTRMRAEWEKLRSMFGGLT